MSQTAPSANPDVPNPNPWAGVRPRFEPFFIRDGQFVVWVVALTLWAAVWAVMVAGPDPPRRREPSVAPAVILTGMAALWIAGLVRLLFFKPRRVTFRGADRSAGAAAHAGDRVGGGRRGPVAGRSPPPPAPGRPARGRQAVRPTAAGTDRRGGAPRHGRRRRPVGVEDARRLRRGHGGPRRRPAGGDRRRTDPRTPGRSPRRADPRRPRRPRQSGRSGRCRPVVAVLKRPRRPRRCGRSGSTGSPCCRSRAGSCSTTSRTPRRCGSGSSPWPGSPAATGS